MSTNHDIFLKNLTYLRTQNNLTPKQMAKRLNVSVRSIKRMEQGELPLSVSAEVLVYIDREFGILPSKVLYTPLWE